MQHLKLLGAAGIGVDGQPLAGRAVQRRRIALLALLATSRARGGPAAGVTRDKLIAWLWPTADAENGRRYLSDSVYRINDALGGEVIVGEADTLRLDTAVLPSDIVDFQDAMTAGDHATAVSRYGGPFLDGFFLQDAPEFERWIDGERDRLAADHARALEALAADATRRGAHADAVDWLRKLAAQDPYSSRVALLLMKAMASAGDRAGALRHARIHETLLRQELDVAPDDQVIAFTESLRTEPVTAPAVPLPSAPVSAPAPGADNTSQTPPPVAPEPPRARAGRPIAQRYLVVAATVVLVAVASLVFTRARATTSELRSLAVLPFANLSPDADNEYFSDGMTDELISMLGRVEGLQVTSRTSAFAYKNRRTDIREIGRQLGVDAVVEGSVRRSGSSLRITTQLVDARSGYRLWSEAFDRQAGDLFAVQEEIARSIVMRLASSVRGQQAPAQHGAARNLEAYDLYLRGRFAWHQRSREGVLRAVDYFQRSVQLEPGYARAHAGLGDAYAVSAFYDFLPPIEAYAKAESSAVAALRLDPGLAAAHATLGYIHTYYQLDWPTAEQDFRRAIALDASYSIAHQWYGNLLTVSGRFDEAEHEMRLAQETDPLSLVANAARGWTLYYAGRYAQALEQLEQTLALDRGYVLAHLWGGWTLEALNRQDEARTWLGRAVELSGGTDITRLALAHLLASSPAGRDSARTILTELTRQATRRHVPSYEIAKVHLALGDRDEALRWLRRVIDERSHSRALLRVDPQLAPLRNDPRFMRLLP